MAQGWHGKSAMTPAERLDPTHDLVIPNPKLKLMDQVREVLRVKHYWIRTEPA